MKEQKYGPNGLPLYKIRVIGCMAGWVVEVEGLPVPNPYGVKLFVHRLTSEDYLYGVSEASTGFLAGRVHCDTVFETVANVLGQKGFEKKLKAKTEEVRGRYPALDTLPIITLTELNQKRREAFLKECEAYDKGEDE